MDGNAGSPGTIHRRAVLASAASAGVGLLAGCSSALVPGAGGKTDSGEPASDSRVEPVTVATIEAPGSDAGEMILPQPETVTLVDLFATWCGPCVEQFEHLREVHREVGDAVRFVSVTNEALGGSLTRADLVEWWGEHGGPWTLGHDESGELFFQLEATGLPYTAVVDPDGRVTWSHRGVARPAAVLEQLAAVQADG